MFIVHADLAVRGLVGRGIVLVILRIDVSGWILLRLALVIVVRWLNLNPIVLILLLVEFLLLSRTVATPPEATDRSLEMLEP